MNKSRVFKLPLVQGMQIVRLDEDSLDYDWKSFHSKFHGTLPYENLRLKNRVTRKDRRFGPAFAIVCLLSVSLILWFRPMHTDLFARIAGLIAAALGGAFANELLRGGTICVQIEPRPFGFRGEFPVPDTRKGRAFLVELEKVWKESLRRRFLIHDEAVLQRIQWLEGIGVLTSEEAAAERSLAENDASPDQKLIGNLAVN